VDVSGVGEVHDSIVEALVASRNTCTPYEAHSTIKKARVRTALVTPLEID
jgi:hypothetical protein